MPFYSTAAQKALCSWGVCQPRSDLLTTSYYCLSCLPLYTPLLSCLLLYTLLYRLNRLHLPHVYIEALELHLINRVLILNLRIDSTVRHIFYETLTACFIRSFFDVRAVYIAPAPPCMSAC